MHDSSLRGQIPWNKGLRGVYKHTAASKAKIVQTLIGRPCSEVTRERIRTAQLGKFIPQSSRDKMSIAKKGRPALNRGITYPETVRARMSISSQGKNAGAKHWNWKGGISPASHAIRESTRYRKWRKAVFERDDYRCFDCGERGGELQAHHLYSFAQYPRLRFHSKMESRCVQRAIDKLPLSGKD
jgi:hypothetical protein